MIPAQPPRYNTYTLRLWEERGAASTLGAEWRFLLINTRTGARHGFSSLSQMMAFLEKEISPSPLPDDS